MYYYEVTKNAILESKVDGKFYLVDFRKNVTDPNEYNWYFTNIATIKVSMLNWSSFTIGSS